jgi:hypothetical protein
MRNCRLNVDILVAIELISIVRGCILIYERNVAECSSLTNYVQIGSQDQQQMLQ